MSTNNGFQKVSKYVNILAAFSLLHTTKASDCPYLPSHNIDFCLTRWFRKVVQNLPLSVPEEKRLIQEYGYQSIPMITPTSPSKQLIPTLAEDNIFDHLPQNIRSYHLAILHKATSLRKPGPGLAILQLKFLSTIYAVNFSNCVFYTNYYHLPPLPYCKKLALAFLDFSLMGTDVLCDLVANLFGQEYVSIFKNYSGALKDFEWTFRSDLEQTKLPSENSSNAADQLKGHVRNPSGYFIKLCEEENKILLDPMSNLNEFIKKMKVKETLPPIKDITHGPAITVAKMWLQAESIYNNSLSQGQLDLMDALFNAKMEAIIQYKFFDEETNNNFKRFQKGDFDLNEDDENIVIKPGDLNFF